MAITVNVDARALKLRIEDDGPGLPSSAAPAFVFGLSNTAKRLDELYDDQTKPVIGRGTLRVVVVSIDLPIIL